MNEKLNLVEILKDVPKGTKLWSPIFGEVEFCGINEELPYYPIRVDTGLEFNSFTADGRYYRPYQGECTLFPSKDQRDWSKFEAPEAKVKYTLHPFDRVLVRDEDSDEWYTGIFGYYIDSDSEHYVCNSCSWVQCIPYNEQTAHLLGTTDPCPIDYDIECSKEFFPKK